MTFKWPEHLPPPIQTEDRTIHAALGIEVTLVEDGHLEGRMPVEDRVRQPYGVLHGGAIAVLAESLASLGTCFGIDLGPEIAFGQEINYSLLRTVRDGHVRAVATAAHRGRTAWVWDVRAYDDAGKLVAIVRCTIAVRPSREFQA